jgi:hypothetical protein
MLRRCLSLMVLVGFLASQLAAMPHAHAAVSADEQAEHDATPHFHLGSAGHHHHDHGDSHSHKGQHSHQGHSKPAKVPADGQIAILDMPGIDHDATAISVTTAYASSASGDERVATDRHDSCDVEAWAFRSDAPPMVRPIPWHPPDEAWDGSGIYLTLRNLRI